MWCECVRVEELICLMETAVCSELRCADARRTAAAVTRGEQQRDNNTTATTQQTPRVTMQHATSHHSHSATPRLRAATAPFCI